MNERTQFEQWKIEQHMTAKRIEFQKPLLDLQNIVEIRDETYRKHSLNEWIRKHVYFIQDHQEIHSPDRMQDKEILTSAKKYIHSRIGVEIYNLQLSGDISYVDRKFGQTIEVHHYEVMIIK